MNNATSMIVVTLAATLAVGGWAGCSNPRVQRNPSLVAEKETRPQAEKKGFLETAGETTMSVVTAPARLIAPEKKPKKEPERWEPAEVIILGPPKVEEEPASPPATQP